MVSWISPRYISCTNGTPYSIFNSRAMDQLPFGPRSTSSHGQSCMSREIKTKYSMSSGPRALGLSIPRSTHQKFVPYLFPILRRDPAPRRYCLPQSAISYLCLIGVYTKNYGLRRLWGSIAARICLLGYPLTSHCSHLTWIISEYGHPSKFLLEQVF